MNKSRMILTFVVFFFVHEMTWAQEQGDTKAKATGAGSPSTNSPAAAPVQPSESKSEKTPSSDNGMIGSGVLQEGTPLNQEVRLEVSDTVSKVFRDMVVVQRKAKTKAKKFLFAPNLGVDFSDGPATLYTMNLNVGYAVNDFWELYVNYVPGFIVQERGIVRMLAAQEIYNPSQCSGSQGSLTCTATQFKLGYAEPKSQMGFEVLWAPAYGKDSWGPYTMFRSDTFFKIGAYQLDFPEVKVSSVLTEPRKGLRFSFMGGKTYFAAKYFNVRVAAGLHQMQTFVGNTEADRQRFNTILFLEGGLVFYL